mgnify:CR=1 FL=1
MSSNAADDARFMRLALRMAERGLGTTAPNPSVGAVVVRHDNGGATVVARGWTERGGRPHAETQALARAGELARGATMYVTLEPCSHHGRTPPCAEAVIAARIARVVVGIEDPDARVAGRGVAMLRTAGIEVVVGVEAAACHWLTLGHILRVTQARPFVQAKLAVSANGLVPFGRAGAPVWVTGALARAAAQMQRAEADAIMVGIGTVLADDPELSCRLPGMQARSPIRVVLDTHLRCPLTARLVQTARQVPTWVVCGPDAHPERRQSLERLGVRVISLSAPGSEREMRSPSVSVPSSSSGEGQGEGGVAAGSGFLVRTPHLSPPPQGGREIPAASAVDLHNVLRCLAAEGITRLLVEGGPTLAKALDDAGLIDEHVLFRGARALADAEGRSIDTIWSADVLRHLQSAPPERLGEDRILRWRRSTTT